MRISTAGLVFKPQRIVWGVVSYVLGHRMKRGCSRQIVTRHTPGPSSAYILGRSGSSAPCIRCGLPGARGANIHSPYAMKPVHTVRNIGSPAPGENAFALSALRRYPCKGVHCSRLRNIQHSMTPANDDITCAGGEGGSD